MPSIFCTFNFFTDPGLLKIRFVAVVLQILILFALYSFVPRRVIITVIGIVCKI